MMMMNDDTLLQIILSPRDIRRLNWVGSQSDAGTSDVHQLRRDEQQQHQVLTNMWMLNSQNYAIILTLKMIFNVSTPFQPGKHEQYEQS